MDSQLTSTGLAHVWTQGDAVTKTVAFILLIMSLATWVIIVWKFLDQRRQRRQALACEDFWHSTDYGTGLDLLGKQSGNPFRALATQGREATHHLLQKDSGKSTQLHDALDLSDWVERALRNSLDDFSARAQSGLTVLASIASTAPFVGLFGTVWGIYHALLSIGSSGQVSINEVAGPIGEALIMTALGLLVAIPAVLGYNALVRGNKGVTHRLNRFGHDLHAYFVTGARVSSGGAAKVLPLKRG
ncbi:MAG: MotA/TolQ/ExbB proton channel family protein [Burkholderiaceae bacterium]